MSFENLPFPANWLWLLYILGIIIYNHKTFSRSARYKPSPINGLGLGGSFTMGILGVFGIISVTNGAQVIIIVLLAAILALLSVPEAYINEKEAERNVR